MITEKGAARAARQLLFHRRRLDWMLERISANEEALREYLARNVRAGRRPPGNAPQRVMLPGGFVVAVDRGGEVVVERVVARGGFVQLTIEELLPAREEREKEEAA